MASGESRKVILVALFANLAIAIVKGIAAAVTRSGAMLAETIHSVADSGNQALLLLGLKRASRPPDASHPFGYGAERYFWAFVVALVLFSLGSLFSLYEGIHKLQHPEPIRSPAWAYSVLVIALVLDGNAWRVAAQAVRRARGDRPFWKYFYESKAPSLPLIYLEDAGAVLGIVIALLGVAAAHLLEWPLADGLATVGIGLLLGAIALVLFRRCHRLLIGESATAEDQAAIREAAAGVAGVAAVRDLRSLHVGPETLLVELEVEMEGGPETVRAVEAAVRARVPHARYISVEQA